LALASVFNPTLRAVREQLYQSERPWVVDSTAFERSFGWRATPLEDAIGETVRWFQQSASP
jgi:nucleoside-diphosphate-sugar epimerase